MALTKDQKQAQIKDLTDKMSSASSIILAHYIGLSVSEVSELRNSLRENEAEMKVAKKTLMKIASKEAGIPEFDDESMEGPISLILSFGDPLSGAQVAFKFGKDHKQVEILGGLYDGKVLSREEAMELAQMPSREILLGTFMGMINSPLTSFASMCNSPLSGFARGLKELAEKGGINPEEAPAPAEKAEVTEEVEKEAPVIEEKTEEKAETPANDSDSVESADEENSDSEKTES